MTLGMFIDLATKQAASAPEARIDEIARVAASGDQHLLDRLRHVFAADADHALGGGQRGQPDLGGQLLHRLFGGGHVKVDLAVQRRVQPAQQQVGVGDGGLGAAAAIADRAELGTRAFRPDAQRAAGIHPADRAAARADAVDVQHRHDDRHFPFQLVVAGDQPLAMLDDGHIEAGAADIGMQDALEAALLGQVAGIGDAAGGTGFQHVLGVLARRLGRHHAAAAFQDQELAGEAVGRKAILQVVHVFHHHRHAGGADGGGDVQRTLGLTADIGSARARYGDGGA